jgi:Arc/MetJ-type ribon-helix-helix transcriptional regulator
MHGSVQLDPETEQTLDRLVRRRAQSRSEVLRQALELLAAQEGESPFDRVADLIGCVSGGPPDLSEETGRKFRQLLERPRPNDPR